MEDERWEPGMPVLDRQPVRTPVLPPSLQGLPPRSVPEVEPTPLQKHYINLSVVVLICGAIAITALELGTPPPDGRSVERPSGPRDRWSSATVTRG